tara:strand:+ start:704 stop:1387 length:684 start_codon:yes stop_codon:yes gene_type:complete
MKIFRNNSHTKKTDLKIYENRIKNENLKWVKQIVEILKSKTRFMKKSKSKISLNDLGCNLFQLYKGLKKKKLNKFFRYKGYDHDKVYVRLGLKYFPELKKKYKIMNLEKKIPSVADISVISATLEHFNNPNKAIKNILKSTKQILIIRSFFGKKMIKKLFTDKKYVDNPYYINQFTFSWLETKFKHHNFKISKINNDRATNSKMRTIYPKIKRKFYIVIATKNGYKI